MTTGEVVAEVKGNEIVGTSSGVIDVELEFDITTGEVKVKFDVEVAEEVGLISSGKVLVELKVTSTGVVAVAVNVWVTVEKEEVCEYVEITTGEVVLAGEFRVEVVEEVEMIAIG